MTQTLARTRKLRIRKEYRYFPMPPDERAALKADIAARGQRVPILADQDGNVLVGHDALEICRELGVAPVVEYRRYATEADKFEEILKRKMLERDPGPVSWARAFQRLLELRGVATGQGTRNDRRLEETRGTSATVAEVAAEFGVSERTARYRLFVADQLRDHPELADQVDRFELTITKALRQVSSKAPITKPKLNGDVSHPARYSAELLEVFAEVLADYSKVLDPFAGTGLIHQLADQGDGVHQTIGIEIEPEWAAQHPATQVGDARDLPFDDGEFDAICTSPTYGNRMADSHDARDPSTRRSYTHDLGRKLSSGNSGRLQWGKAYRDFHEQAWDEIIRVLKPRGRFVLNIKDHIRAGVRQYVSGWHVTTLCNLGLELLFHVEVEASGMRAGSNGDLRCPEFVYVFENPA